MGVITITTSSKDNNILDFNVKTTGMHIHEVIGALTMALTQKTQSVITQEITNKQM